MTLPAFSLDSPPPVNDPVLSGYNFREVAPEVLSPLTWSIIGAGMDTGFRQAAQELGFPEPRGARPYYIGYVAFRPFFNMTTVGTMASGLPGVRAADIWDLLLGGPPPTVADIAPYGSRLRRAALLRRQAAFFEENGSRFGSTAEAVGQAESLVAAALSSGSVLSTGAAFEAAVAAGRAAWALHIRTTCVALMSAALMRRALRLRLDDASALELLRSVARRSDEGGHGSDEAGRLRVGLDRITSYEVADRSGPFASFGDSPAPTPALMSPAEHGGAGSVGLLTGTALGPLFERLGRVMEVGLGERERSKALGLRALHCVRLLLDSGQLGICTDDASFLAVHELKQEPAAEQRRRIEQRSEELAEAAQLEVPVDLQQTRRGAVAVVRPRTFGVDGGGVPLAGGWAEGTLCVESDGEEGRIVVGARVDGNYVLAMQPEAVVSTFGSILSHVAIVCRELGIPLVSGVEVKPDQLGRRAVVDGWAGSVTVVDDR